MSTFGYTTHAGSATYISPDPALTKFTAPESGTITSMTAWCKTYYGGTVNMRFAIYSDNAGTPQSKLAESASAVTVNASNTEFSTGISLAITASTVYWLAMWNDSANGEMAYDAGSSHQASISTGITYPTWPSTWSEVFALDRVYSIYATYTPAATGKRIHGEHAGMHVLGGGLN